MRKTLWILCCAALAGVPLVATAQTAEPTGAKNPMAGDWLERVRPDHPRMYIAKETWPKVKEYALEHERKYYEEAIKKPVAALPVEPDRKACEAGSQKRYGPSAQMSAFVWLMEGDRAALEKAKNYLREGVRFYNRCSSAGQTVNWYSSSRVQALTAYDWIYSELTPAERAEIANGFFQHFEDCLAGQSFPGQNRSDYKSGFYGPTNLAWYVGLAFYKDDVDDARAEALLKRGYGEHIQLLDWRSQAAGDDGGAASIAVGYALGMYPWAEFNFMHTYDSATGLAIEESYDHLSLLPNWVLWNRLPNNMHWGLGDSAPAGKYSDHFLDTHLLQVAHFYARAYPDRASQAMWIYRNALANKERDSYWWPVPPLLLTRCGELPEPKGPEADWPLGRNFENMGLVTMRSNWTDDAVFAAFVAGGSMNSHRHYDQGHFIINRAGDYLALDSGDYGPRERIDHLTEYLYRSVAHNTLLIEAPPEADRPAKVWGGAAKTLDGGQCEIMGRQIAFETNRHYTYAAVDLTAAYDSRKCKRAIRQFVFVYPDTFVVFDRVEAARPEYGKAWLLHSANEPKFDAGGRKFRVELGASAMEGVALAPADAQVTKVGGPGKEFWSAGANHPQEGEFVKMRELEGAWRVEVRPGAARAADTFLHVLRVGAKGAEFDGGVEAVRGPGMLGALFRKSDGEAVTISFNETGETGGRVEISSIAAPTAPPALLVHQPLATTLQPQAGIGIPR